MLIPSLSLQAKPPSDLAQETASYAVTTYQNDMVTSLAKLVKYHTVAIEGIAIIDNPAHIAFKAELQRQALALGFDFTDHGALVVIGYGKHQERLGIITHGDVQPVNESKWQKSPFELDTTSEPGKLIARGAEDDKGPIVSALYAMKAIKDQKLKLNKRLELYVYIAEESDWQPLRDFVNSHELPQTNITLDSSYPVVNAEKGYGTISLTFADAQVMSDHAYIKRFTGGAFGSQIPEDAKIVIKNANYTLLEKLIKRITKFPQMTFNINMVNNEIIITALGKSVAIGGGTNSRLSPNAVSFGPSMPNTPYTGHSEHEFITMEQFVMNLKMYTAVLVELAQQED